MTARAAKLRQSDRVIPARYQPAQSCCGREVRNEQTIRSPHRRVSSGVLLLALMGRLLLQRRAIPLLPKPKSALFPTSTTLETMLIFSSYPGGDSRNCRPH